MNNVDNSLALLILLPVFQTRDGRRQVLLLCRKLIFVETKFNFFVEIKINLS